MRTNRWRLGLLLWSVSTAALASDFDGSKNLICEQKVVHDCLPGGKCKDQKASEAGIATSVSIDFAKKEVRTPYRTKPLPVGAVQVTKTQLIAQGMDGRMGWTSVIQLEGGALAIAIADLKGAYVLFGQCKVAPDAPAAAPAEAPAAAKPE